MRGAAICQRSAQHRTGLVIHQTGIGDAIAACECLTIIGFGGIIGRYRQRSLINRQLARNIGNVIIAGCQTRYVDDIIARIDGRLRGATIGQRSVQHRTGFVIHQTGIGNTVAADEGQAIIGFGRIIGRYRQPGLANRQLAWNISNVIIAGRQTRHIDGITARIDGPLRAPAICQRSAQHRTGLVVHQT